MGSVCAEQHKFQPSHQLLSSSKKSLLREIDIPPRKLLTRRHHQEYIPSDIYTTDSPRFSSADEALLRKFLPYNSGADDDDDDPDASDPYSSDHFRMFEFKVRRCTRSRSHDWTDCPFAHPGEKARRRDPRRHHYSGTVCADYRRGCCSRGDSCEFAHGVFECWLHPARYRTEACKDGKNCKRKVCFFAHTPRQLRVLPVQSSRSSSPEVSPVAPSKKYHLNLNSAAAAVVSPNHCCLYCHNCATSSPTSTLLSMSHLSSSPPLSPPLSPAANKHCSSSSSLNGFHSSSSPMSRYSTSSGGGYDQMHAGAGGNMMTYKDVLAELMSSLEAMKVNDQTSSAPNIVSPINRSSNVPNWVDVSSFNAAAADQDHQQQFILSPSSIPSPCGNYFSTTGDCSSRKSLFNIDHHEKLMNDINGAGSSSSPDPDLGWVNDLLM